MVIECIYVVLDVTTLSQLRITRDKQTVYTITTKLDNE